MTFNEILRHDEKEEDEPKEERCIRNVQMFDVDLVDYGFKGGAYTWRNNREGVAQMVGQGLSFKVTEGNVPTYADDLVDA